MSALRNAIIAHLKADAPTVAAATGGIWPGLPPKGRATYPFISVTAQKPPEGVWTFQQVACEDAVYLVKAIDRNASPKAAADIKALIRTSLNLASLTIEGYDSMGLLWLREVSYSELDDSGHYQHEGGLYSLMAEET